MNTPPVPIAIGFHGYKSSFKCVATTEIRNAWKPDYATWQSEFERHLSDEPMKLVGHSCGGGFLLRWLSENPSVTVERLAFVAPWLDPFRSDTTDFFDFTIDPELAERVGRIDLFHSTDDTRSVAVSVDTIMAAIPGVQLHRYENKGHFCYGDMGTVVFSDLLLQTLIAVS